MQAFGYTRETLDMLLVPMARAGAEPLGSMGNDAPLAILSRQPRQPYDYLKQLFAQVRYPFKSEPQHEGISLSPLVASALMQ